MRRERAVKQIKQRRLKPKNEDSHTDTRMRQIQEDEKSVMQKVVIKWCSLGENYLLNAKYLKLSRLYQNSEQLYHINKYSLVFHQTNLHKTYQLLGQNVGDDVLDALHKCVAMRCCTMHINVNCKCKSKQTCSIIDVFIAVLV